MIVLRQNPAYGLLVFLYMIKQIPILDLAQCAEIKSKLYSLRDSWLPRGKALAALDDLGFYTLGYASYLDISSPMAETYYYDEAAKMNKLLLENFSDLYDMIPRVIERELGQVAVYHSGFALPGFHIYEADFFFTEPFAPYHYDLHHYLLDWQGLNYNRQQTISLTLALDLPEAGAGLYFWPQYKFIEPELDQVNYEQQRKKMFDVDLSEQPRELYQHQVGSILLHTGMTYHQMAAMPEMNNGEARITLQGHAVLADDGVWRLFW